MFAQTFYFGLIRKYVILVGTLFNNIRITRTDSSGNTNALIKVPITFSAKDKMLARVMQDPNIDRPSATLPLPMISFEMGNMSYDGSRKLPTVNRVVAKGDTASKFKYQYNPVPYNINFKVYIYSKNAEDGTKIVEQILPYFTPDWTTTVNLIPEVDVVMDIPVILDSITCNDNYDTEFKTRRAIIWTLNFTLKGYLYGPVKKTSIIKFANTNFYIPSVPDGSLGDAVGNTAVAERLTVQPGLDANGSPTTNVEITIPYTDIEPDDNYDYIIRIFNGEDL